MLAYHVREHNKTSLTIKEEKRKNKNEKEKKKRKEYRKAKQMTSVLNNWMQEDREGKVARRTIYALKRNRYLLARTKPQHEENNCHCTLPRADIMTKRRIRFDRPFHCPMVLESRWLSVGRQRRNPVYVRFCCCNSVTCSTFVVPLSLQNTPFLKNFVEPPLKDCCTSSSGGASLASRVCCFDRARSIHAV